MSRVSLAHDAERSRHKGTVDSGVHAWSARCVVRLAWLCSSASSSSVYPSGSISSPTAVCSAIFRSQLIRASSLFICLNCAAVSVWVPALHRVVLHRQQPTTAFGRTRHRHRSTWWHSCSRRSPRHSSAGGEIGCAGASACSGGGTAGRCTVRCSGSRSCHGTRSWFRKGPRWGPTCAARSIPSGMLRTVDCVKLAAELVLVALELLAPLRLVACQLRSERPGLGQPRFTGVFHVLVGGTRGAAIHAHENDS